MAPKMAGYHAEGDVLRPEDFERSNDAAVTTTVSHEPDPAGADPRPPGSPDAVEPSPFRHLGEVLDHEITLALENGSAARPIGRPSATPAT